MTLLAVGSMAIDSVKTPFGERSESIGGSATYFSISASFFTDVSLVAVVGSDFPETELEFLESRNIDLSGVEISDGKTFRWKGEYHQDMNVAHTLDTQLNVFQNFKPKIPEKYQDIDYLFLANIDPDLQISVLDQVRTPKLVACDTMNFWIEGKKDSLMKIIHVIDVLIINDAELCSLADEKNILSAAKKIKKLGLNTLVVKRGEFGAILFHEGEIFAIPAFPIEDVIDPTGAGDTFAGGFMGFLALNGMGRNNVRNAVVYGSVMASFNVQSLSFDRLKELTKSEIFERYEKFSNLIQYKRVQV
ncbi:MAG: PfkB family carbohydrate kinase [Nitrospinota bacterium]|nr:PfkB family carbohydrate kinase [Nitrospinota bacterium]